MTMSMSIPHNVIIIPAKHHSRCYIISAEQVSPLRPSLRCVGCRGGARCPINGSLSVARWPDSTQHLLRYSYERQERSG